MISLDSDDEKEVRTTKYGEKKHAQVNPKSKSCMPTNYVGATAAEMIQEDIRKPTEPYGKKNAKKSKAPQEEYKVGAKSYMIDAHAHLEDEPTEESSTPTIKYGSAYKAKESQPTVKFGAKRGKKEQPPEELSKSKANPDAVEEEKKIAASSGATATQKFGAKKIHVSKLLSTELNCPFEFYRKVSGSVEFAVLVRFLEYLLQANLDYGEMLLAEFKNAVLCFASKFFQNMKCVQLSEENSQLFSEFMERMEKQLAEQLKATKGEIYLKSSNILILQGMVDDMVKELNENYNLCKALTALLSKKKMNDISSCLGLPISLMRLPDYKIQEKHEAKSAVFAADQQIYVACQSSSEVYLFYTKRERNFLCSETTTTRVFGKSKKRIFVLPCGHLWNIKIHTPAALKCRKSNPLAKLVLKCPQELCFYVLDAVQAKEVLGKNFFVFFNDPEKVDTNACIIDGNSLMSNIKIDDKHSLCIKCMGLYLIYKRRTIHLDTDGKPIPLECPVKDCKVKFGVNKYFPALPKNEWIALQKEHQKYSKKKASPVHKEKVCLLCSKYIFNGQNATSHSKCKATFHTECLKGTIKEYSIARAIHEILCKTCGNPFLSSEIEALFPKDDATLINLRRNFVKKAETLQCPVCGNLLSSDQPLNRIVKCACGLEICRLCGNEATEPLCYPRHKIIKALSGKSEVTSVLPCPRCMQLNVLKMKEVVSVCINCKATFCGSCGADKEVIYYHGSSYHRPGCPIAKANVSGKLVCELCNKGKACKKPNMLDSGELPKEEVKIKMD